MPILAADKTEILFDGQPIPGIRGFSYKVHKEKQDVRGLGKVERIGVVYGGVQVKGQILVHSNSELLNKHMDEGTAFQIVVQIPQTSYPESLGTKKLTFDGCHIEDREFQIDAHGYGLTTYTFTADRVREE